MHCQVMLYLVTIVTVELNDSYFLSSFLIWSYMTTKLTSCLYEMMLLREYLCPFSYYSDCSKIARCTQNCVPFPLLFREAFDKLLQWINLRHIFAHYTVAKFHRLIMSFIKLGNIVNSVVLNSRTFDGKS